MSKGLRELLKRRDEERRAVINRARQFSLKLREKLGEVTVLLYGSYARGDFNLWSDVDLLIISPSFSGVPPLKRLDMVADDLPPKFEARCFSPEEAIRELRKPWWGKVLGESLILVDDLNILEALKSETSKRSRFMD